MEALRLSGDDAELLVLEAVRLERMTGGSGTAAGVARALGRDDYAAVRRTLDALMASGQLEYEQADDVCVDCDWPAAPLEAYRLTHWGKAALATLGTGAHRAATPPRSEAAREHAIEHVVEHAVELGMQAFQKTGDVREAIIEALTCASPGGQLAGEAAAAIA
jgi:hypothetical protein